MEEEELWALVLAAVAGMAEVTFSEVDPVEAVVAAAVEVASVVEMLFGFAPAGVVETFLGVE